MCASRRVQLRRFDPSTIRNFSTVLFTGGRGTGKSSLARDIMWNVRGRIYSALAFTGTNDKDHPLEEYFGDANVMHTFDEMRMFKFLDDQEQRRSVVDAYNAKDGTAFERPQGLIYFEDLEYLKKPIWNYESVRALWFNGRHHGTMAFCAFQYIMEIKLALRGMFDYAMFTMEPNVAVRERIWKQFGGVCATFREFDDIFTTATANWGALIVDCRARSYRVDDAMCWYKADHRDEQFSIGWVRGGGAEGNANSPST